MNRCISSTLGTDALVLKHQGNSIHNADPVCIIQDQYKQNKDVKYPHFHNSLLVIVVYMKPITQYINVYIRYAFINHFCPCCYWPFKSYLRHFYFQMIWLEGPIGECHNEPWMKLIGFNGWLIRANLIKSSEHWCNLPSPQSSGIQWLTHDMPSFFKETYPDS